MDIILLLLLTLAYSLANLHLQKAMANENQTKTPKLSEHQKNEYPLFIAMEKFSHGNNNNLLETRIWNLRIFRPSTYILNLLHNKVNLLTNK